MTQKRSAYLELADGGVDAVHGGQQLGGAVLDLYHALRLQHAAPRRGVRVPARPHAAQGFGHREASLPL